MFGDLETREAHEAEGVPESAKGFQAVAVAPVSNKMSACSRQAEVGLVHSRAQPKVSQRVRKVPDSPL